MDKTIYGKVPPQAIDAEKTMLGILLLHSDKLEDVMGILENGDAFHDEDNQKIYDAMIGVYNSGSKADSITVSEQLQKEGEQDVRKFIIYMSTLTASVVNSANVVKYAQIIKEKHLKRELIKSCSETLNQAYDETVDIFDLIDFHSATIGTLGDINGSEQPVHIQKIAVEEVKHLHERKESNVAFTGIPTGYRHLDRLTGGWQDTDLIILAARPSVGKTAFTVNLSLNAAETLERPINVAFFSLEMSKEQLGKRALSLRSGVDMDKIYKNATAITDVEMQQIERTVQRFGDCRLFINDRAAITPNYVKRVATSLNKKHGLDMIVIDYIQLMRSNIQIKGNREQEVSNISRDLKELAKSLRVPIIALSQLNRDVTGEPQLKNLRESGAIEQDADMVMFLYRPEEENKTNIILSVKKHRNGACDDLAYEFDGSKQKFSEPSNGFIQMIPDNPRAGINTKQHF